MNAINKILCTSLIFIMIGCSTIKQNSIIYLLSTDTENSIYKVVRNVDYNFAFFMEPLSDSTYMFSLVKITDNEMAALTNRKLFINDRLYPIIFQTDYFFYSKVKKDKPLVNIQIDRSTEKQIFIPSIEERYKNKNMYSGFSKYPLWHNYYYWIVDIRGNLIGTNLEAEDND